MENQIAVQQELDLVKFPVGLKDLVKPLGYRDHSHCLQNFESFCKLLKNNNTYIMGSYLNKNRVSVNSYSMTLQLAKMFAMRHDVQKGFEYVQALEEKVSQLILVEKQALEAKVKQLTALPPKTLTMSSKVNRRSIHQLRRELFAMGMCNMDYKLVKHYKFSVTTKGFANDYEENDKGDIIV